MRIPHPHLSGRTKLAMFGTALGAAMTYIISKPALRKELQKAESTKDAMDIVAKHVKRDTRELSDDVQEFMKSPEMKTRWKSVKNWVGTKREAIESKARAAKDKAARKAAETAEKAEKTVKKVEERATADKA